MNKDQAMELLHKNMQNQNLRRHCYAVSIAMGGLYDYLKEHEKLDANAPSKETWEIFGLLHDADYELTKDDWSKHTIVALGWLKENGISETDPLYLGIMSHNNKVTGLRNLETQMEWALECCDELTGFLVACALVTPEKKLEAVKMDSVPKKWRSKGFAGGVDREQTEQCEEKLGISLNDFIETVLLAMQKEHELIGL